MRLAIAALTLLLTAACASVPPNPPKKPVDPSYGYRFGTMKTPARADDTFVILTFSGGGTRAAALAYGVLEELGATRIRAGSTDMLAAVDVISSVSGGSFTAAHYALFGRDRLPELRENLLDQPGTQRGLYFAAARNFLRLLSPRYNRIDVAVEYFDRRLYGGKTFADIPKDAPYTILNATEMDLATRFEFTQEQFDVICSDLGAVKVARAVAASSAFPVLLTPMPLRSYSGDDCNYRPNEWFQRALGDRDINPRRYRFAAELGALMEKDRRFLHLIDGGVADNIGLRGPYHALRSLDTLQMNDGNPIDGFSVVRLIGRRQIKRVIVIAVNAKTTSELNHDRRRATPMIPAVLANSSSTPMGNYSFDTITMVQESFRDLNTQLDMARQLDIDVPNVEHHFIEVAFSALPREQQTRFNEMGTNYSLSKEDVARLIAVGREILRGSAEYQKVVAAMQQ